MKIVSMEENINIDILIEKIAKGEVVIPANKNHKSLKPKGVEVGLRQR